MTTNKIRLVCSTNVRLRVRKLKHRHSLEISAWQAFIASMVCGVDSFVLNCPYFAVVYNNSRLVWSICLVMIADQLLGENSPVIGVYSIQLFSWEWSYWWRLHKFHCFSLCSSSRGALSTSVWMNRTSDCICCCVKHSLLDVSQLM